MGNCLQRTKNVDHISTNNPHSTPGATQSPSQSSHPLPTPSMPLPKSNVKDRSQVLPIPRSESEILSSPHLKSFSFTELQNATRNFRPDSLLGEGGFGYVYKGWLDKEKLTAAMPGSGMVVAVKKLKPKGFQGHKEWLCEVNYLGQLDHPNLVKLIGFCLEGDNRMLVYEFMPRGCLEDYLFTRGGSPLSWEIRIKVAIQTARGLSFLHGSKPQIIFRDFKASNILLDTEFNAKLSDFGLAKAGPTGDLTHVTTQVFGTQGYAAPEYVSTGRLTAKCDVYSFGVVLLELLTGRLAVDKRRVGPEQKLLDWVKPQLPNKKKLFRIMDSKLEGQYPRKGAFVAANLALQCAHSEPKYRPQMSEVVSILEKIPALKHASAPSAMEGVETSSSPLDDSTTWHSNLSSMKQTTGKSRKTSAQGSSPSLHGHRIETCPKGSSLPVHHMISSPQGSSEIPGDDE